MSRFSPVVSLVPRMSGLEALARAFQTGADQFEETVDTTRRRRKEDENRKFTLQDRKQEAQDRATAASRQADQDFINGIMAPRAAAQPTATPAPTRAPSPFVGPPQDGYGPEAAVAPEQLAAALQPSTQDIPAAAPPQTSTARGRAQAVTGDPSAPPAQTAQSSSGVAGGFDAIAGEFAKVPPRVAPVQLPSGRMYDPQSVMDRERASALQTALGKAEGDEFASSPARARRMRQLVQAQRIYPLLTPQLAEIVADNEELYNEFMLDLLNGFPDRTRAQNSGRTIPGEHTGGVTNTMITAAERELARVLKAAPQRDEDREKVVFGIPLDEQADSTFRADSTSYDTDYTRPARGQLDALRRAFGTNVPIIEGEGEPIPSPTINPRTNRDGRPRFGLPNSSQPAANPITGAPAPAASAPPRRTQAEIRRAQADAKQLFDEIQADPSATREEKELARAAYQRAMQLTPTP